MPEAAGPLWIQRRTAWIALAGLLLALVLGGLTMYGFDVVEARQDTDQRLLAFAQGIQMANQACDARVPAQPASGAMPAVRYQAWSAQGDLHHPDCESPTPAPYVPLDRAGWHDVRIDGTTHRVLNVRTAGGEVIQVAQGSGAARVSLAKLGAYGISFALLPMAWVIAANGWLARQPSPSTQALADALARSQPLEGAPIRHIEAPEPWRPVMTVVDELLERARHAVEAERRFTSMVAHELGGPLAGIRGHAQIGQGARDPAATQIALRAIIVGVDRASHTLDQLLDLARLDALPSPASAEFRRVALAPVLGNVMLGLEARGRFRQVQVLSDFRAPWVLGLEFGIFLVLRNLVANALMYASEGGRVEVSSQRLAQSIVLNVDDTGPGIAEHEREQAFERFNRLGNARSDGLGLGLSIVARVVRMHGASIELLDSPIGGLRAQVIFPVRPDDESDPTPAATHAA